MFVGDPVGFCVGIVGVCVGARVVECVLVLGERVFADNRGITLLSAFAGIATFGCISRKGLLIRSAWRIMCMSSGVKAVGVPVGATVGLGVGALVDGCQQIILVCNFGAVGECTTILRRHTSASAIAFKQVFMHIAFGAGAGAGAGASALTLSCVGNGVGLGVLLQKLLHFVKYALCDGGNWSSISKSPAGERGSGLLFCEA